MIDMISKIPSLFCINHNVIYYNRLDFTQFIMIYVLNYLSHYLNCILFILQLTLSLSSALLISSIIIVVIYNVLDHRNKIS